MGASTVGKICAALAVAMLLPACSSGPSSAAKEESDQQELLAAFEGLEPAEIIRAGDAAAAQGEAERALFIYNQALVLQPSADAWFGMGQAYRQLGQKPQAWRAYASALQLDPDYAAAHEEIGLLHLGMKQPEPAEKHLQRAIELDPGRWRAHNALGVMADVRKDYVSAIAHYNAALEANPNSAMLLNNLGYSHYLAGNLAEAEKHLRIAVGIDPSYTPAVANLGLSHARRGDYDEAVEILRQVMDQRQAYNDVGFVAYHNGDLEDAAWLLTEAIQVSPTYYEAARRNLRRVREAIAERADQRSADMADRSGPGEAAGAGGSSPPAVSDNRSVHAAGLNVRSAASPTAPVIVQLSKGQQVEVMYELGGWAFIEFWLAETDARQAGWVNARYLQPQVTDRAESVPVAVQNDAAAVVVEP
jgi:Flp pilus assembly protein TadD